LECGCHNVADLPSECATSGKNLKEQQTERQTGWDQIDDSAVETGKAKGDAVASNALFRFKGATKGVKK
jgi:hypothetical protein